MSLKRKNEDKFGKPISQHKQLKFEEVDAEAELISKTLFGSSSLIVNKEAEDAKNRQPKKVWNDDDEEMSVGEVLKKQNRVLPEGGKNDKSNNYTKLLQQNFNSINACPKWAKLDRAVEDSDEDDEILETCGFTKKIPSIYLPPSVLEYKERRNLNCETYNEGPYINAVEFLQEASVALIAGQSGIASLYAVDDKKNVKLYSCKYENFPIFKAKVVENNHEIFFGSRYPYFHCFNFMAAKSTKVKLPSGLNTCKNFNISSDQSLMAIAGTWGEIHLLCTKTKERICVLKQNSDVTALAFGFGSDLLYAHSNSGEVTIFDINMRQVKHTFIDEGCLQGTTIAISQSNRFLAAGSAQGVVNLYDTHCIYKNKAPKPEKALMNLTTKISSIAFNSTSEMLAYASADIPNSLKLYHIGSHKTFENFPSFHSKYGNVNVLNFSPNSGYIAFGNSKSCVSLCRLTHYKHY